MSLGHLGRVTTEKRRALASKQMRRHWLRCEKWGAVLEISKMEINRHWRCCVKAANGNFNGEGQPDIDNALSVRKAYAECLLRNAQQSKRLADQHYKRQQARYVRPSEPPVEEEEILDLDHRIKIMLWAVKKCGGVEIAQDAFRRAVRSLEDE